MGGDADAGHQATAPSADGAARVAALTIGRPEASEPLRILVVEPDLRLARLLSIALRSRGWLVHCVTEVTWAVDEMAGDEYALLLLDLDAGIEGETLLHHALATRDGQRVMVISDSSEKEWIVRCFNAGVVDYLSKPFVIAELLARVQARLRLPAPTPAEPERLTRHGGLSLDWCRHTADVGRGPVRLTNREFVLIEFLVSNPGRVFTREELLKSAWGLAFDPSSNLVEVYVRRLRMKLGEDIVETVHRKGYVFAGAASGPSHDVATQVVRLQGAPA
jgi:two-component system, OmpR family, response regulator